MDGISLNPGVPWPAVDGLGRHLPVSGDGAPAPRPNRCVGIFYFLWNGYHDAPDAPLYDVAKILATDPEALGKPDSPLWGREGQMHFWGEPLFGYYRNADPWVLRRHAHLLADAGIDTLIFDTTNRVTYKDVVLALCDVFAAVRREGSPTPQITFMTNTRAGETAQEIYEFLYKPGLHPELWFHWQGRPLLICDPADASPEVRGFFTLRRAHWPFQMVNTPHAWHWEAAYPQPYGYADDPSQPEQVNVSVAQNLRVADGKVTNMSEGDARGRSFHDGAVDTTPGAVDRGLNFQEQWKRAIELDPPFVMVTGWNEWIAGRWSRPGKPIVFVDQFDQQGSRDIEPVRGLHGDHYYYQLVANVRRHKGVPPIPRASEPRTIHIDGPFSQWCGVEPAFGDHDGETLPRDHAAVARMHCVNRSGRNEFLLLKVARDDTHLYFYARTRDAVSPCDGPGWMLLLIDTQPGVAKGWEGFGYLANRQVDASGSTTLERSAGGWRWEVAGRARFRVEGREMHLAVPKAALGLANGNLPLTIDFKWIDNPQVPGDPADLYLSGDTAPLGRFRYRYMAI